MLDNALSASASGVCGLVARIITSRCLLSPSSSSHTTAIIRFSACIFSVPRLSSSRTYVCFIHMPHCDLFFHLFSYSIHPYYDALLMVKGCLMLCWCFNGPYSCDGCVIPDFTTHRFFWGSVFGLLRPYSAVSCRIRLSWLWFISTLCSHCVLCSASLLLSLVFKISC
jgi:hypothetical protein